MKTFILTSILALTFVSAAQGGTKSGPPQTVFQIEEYDEEESKAPVKLPNDVLEILRRDERTRACLSTALWWEGQSAASITAEWFKALEADLNADALTDLVVKPDKLCLSGANIAPFWVFLNTPQGYKLVLNVDALGIEVLKTKSHGAFDIRATKASAVQVFSGVFRFNGETYETKKTPRKR
jgi:hypothetical protein